MLTGEASCRSTTTTTRRYLYGDFVNDLVISRAPGSGCPAEIKPGNMISAAVAEAARTTIRAALMGW